MTKGPTGRHVPAAGTKAAKDVERARTQMLHEAKPRGRTRIGADVVCEALIRQGVDVLFGYPGGVILPLYDVWATTRTCATSWSATSRARPTRPTATPARRGKVGVCLGTSGPGATNLVTGIATAQLDSIPIVAITGNVPGALIGKDAFQEIDITGITLPMTKHNYLVRNADDIPRVIAEAFHIARTGRPGPVHVDITKDALQQETTAPHPSDEEARPARLQAQLRRPPQAAQDGRARDRRTPSGRSSWPATASCVAEARDDLRAFAEKTQIPVAHTLLGIGAIDERTR